MASIRRCDGGFPIIRCIYWRRPLDELDDLAWYHLLVCVKAGISSEQTVNFDGLDAHPGSNLRL